MALAGCVQSSNTRAEAACASVLTPYFRPLAQAMTYGVDGNCLSCPGISLSKKRSTTISNCTCPVSPPLRAFAHSRMDYLDPA